MVFRPRPRRRRRERARVKAKPQPLEAAKLAEVKRQVQAVPAKPAEVKHQAPEAAEVKPGRGSIKIPISAFRSVLATYAIQSRSSSRIRISDANDIRIGFSGSVE